VVLKKKKKNPKENPFGFYERMCKVIRTERYQVTSFFASCCSKWKKAEEYLEVKRQKAGMKNGDTHTHTHTG